ncbi:UPF0182 family membrane protein [Amnibacterium sp.]|uniref:UPF0182 family membrane protein n=1 Tax=Amnibacterium sp. TaxID=1872496 RepID=UPI003F7BAEA3
MTTQAAAPARRRRAALAITLGVVVVLLIGFFLFAGLYTDALWFGKLGYSGVLYTEWLTIASLFVVGFVAMAGPVILTIQLAYRLRPVYAKLTAQLDRYQQVIEPLRRVVMIGAPIVIGLFAGVSAAARWQPILLLLHAQNVPGKTDPIFHLNVGFYLFTLPALHGIVGFASAVLVVCTIAALATSYLYGGIRIVGRDIRVSRAARVQIAVTFAIFLVLQAISLYLDQFTTLSDTSTGGLFTGAAYADVNAVIPGRLILAVCALLVAALFVVTAVIGRWRLPLIGTALLVVVSIVVGSVFPWAMWNLQVKPNEGSLERPYITNAISATQSAYGVSGVQQISYNAKTTAQPGALRSDAQTTANIRIIDPDVVSPTFAQLQQFKQYYKFPQFLDVDRYTINGTSQDAVVAVRELNQSGLQTPSPYNNTFVYTHGYGIVAAYGNQRTDSGAPSFFESNIPSSGALDVTKPGIYFGENSPAFSVVGAPKGSKPAELDYVSGEGANGQQHFTTYSATGPGEGGPSVGNVFNRLVYALKFSSDQILLSNAVNADSQILYDRDPKARVQKVAPYLTLDSDPYPSVVNGRIVWIVDGYTTSSSYPYSSSESLSDALSNSSANTSTSYATDQINYIRNSVKATVDAYTGKVTLYAWDASDPVLKAWENVFPSTVQPMSKMSGELISHVRYPEDLFRVQRQVLAQYHVTDPTSWYQGDNQWRVPQDTSSATETDASSKQPPYYLTMKLPGQTSPTFSLYSTYIPGSSAADQRGVLTGYLAVDADAGATAGTKRADYGKLRLLVLPQGSAVSGPTQVQASFQSDTTIKSQLNLLNIGGSGGSSVIYGNLLTIPVGGGLLYVEPVYVKSSSGSSYPLLRKVLTAFGGNVQIQDTLDQSLNALFGGNSGTNTPDSSNGSGSSSGSGSGSTSGSGTGSTSNAKLQAALADAKQALADREAAYAKNDLVAAAQADQKLQQAIAAAIAAEG